MPFFILIALFELARRLASMLTRTQKPTIQEPEEKRVVQNPQEKVKVVDVPVKSITKEIGVQGGRIEVAGCSVEFPPGALKEPQYVTASADIESPRRPFELGQIISPTFTVDDIFLQAPATVTLTTWCVKEDDEDEEVVIHIAQFSEHHGKWGVMEELPMNSVSQVDMMCWILGRMVAFVPTQYSQYSFKMKFYFFDMGRGFKFTLKEDNDLIVYNEFLDIGLIDEAGLSAGPYQLLTKNGMICKKGVNVEFRIDCLQPEGLFWFLEEGPFHFHFDDTCINGKIALATCHLVSRQDTEQDVIIGCHVHNGENRVFEIILAISYIPHDLRKINPPRYPKRFHVRNITCYPHA